MRMRQWGWRSTADGIAGRWPPHSCTRRACAIGYLLRELLFDEDTLAIFSLGLVPFLSGLLSLVSKLRSSRVSEREVALGNGVEK